MTTTETQRSSNPFHACARCERRLLGRCPLQAYITPCWVLTLQDKQNREAREIDAHYTKVSVLE